MILPGDQQRRVLVVDMQPITPPIGGGRLRLLGIYHALGCHLATRYIGSYDWPGPPRRTHQVSESLTEITIPLSPEHHRVSDRWRRQTGGKTVIDVGFHRLAPLSPDYVRTVHEETPRADVIVCSHPWVYPLLKSLIDSHRQILVYDAHNVEGWLRYQLLGQSFLGRLLAREVLAVEAQLCRAATLILACSHEDRQRFHRFYEVPMAKIRIVANGVFTRKVTPASAADKPRLKQQLDWDRRYAAVFIGSSYPPNIEAAHHIVEQLAPSRPDILFALCGSVGDAFAASRKTTSLPPNVRFLGTISEEQKITCLRAADVALNPMSSGSGTNIKMFDYFAAGLPTLTTPIGARGISPSLEPCYHCVPLSDFGTALDQLLQQPRRRTQLGRNARNLAVEKFSWERISPAVGRLLHRCVAARHGAPFFSVIVPTYQRHDCLTRLLHRLAAQTWRDFEVIVVDQSTTPWSHRRDDFGIQLVYLHTDIKGAVKARNSACFLARGEVLAFVDDDCEPSADWLLNAHRYFVQTSVIGLEGLIRCPLKQVDPKSCRIVSNENFRGLGFMTANLFLRTEVFNAIDGFDERFDDPHFREDTDLAWRALDHGPIPFAEDVVVSHPPHSRSQQRESERERNRFFIKDALLLKKHPQRYKELFFAERQWEKSEAFGHYLLAGAKRYGVTLPAWCFEPLSSPAAAQETSSTASKRHGIEPRQGSTEIVDP